MVAAAWADGRIDKDDPDHFIDAAFACWGKLDPQHVIPQGRGGPDDAENLASCCRGHHGWVEEHPRLAYLIGLSKKTEAKSE